MPFVLAIFMLSHATLMEVPVSFVHTNKECMNASCCAASNMYMKTDLSYNCFFLLINCARNMK